MILIVARYLIPKGYRGITFFPFILVRNEIDKNDKITINHERIHIRQQLELLIIPFFIWYVIAFIFQYAKTGDKHQAYRNIVFEKEAYASEHDLQYLQRRSFWGFLKYY